jgi:hypothetical protein
MGPGPEGARHPQASMDGIDRLAAVLRMARIRARPS